MPQVLQKRCLAVRVLNWWVAGWDGVEVCEAWIRRARGQRREGSRQREPRDRPSGPHYLLGSS